MYHIVFAADDAYIPYTAVAITSIIKSTNIHHPTYKQEPYIFNILSDYISDDTKARLKTLESELNTLYPCQIVIHILNDDHFKKFPRIHGYTSFAAYYRLSIGQFFPESLGKCLYLDGDILVRSDIRELFDVNLGDKIAGVVKDVAYIHRQFVHKTKQGENVKCPAQYYFNSGVIMLNLKPYYEQNIEEKALEFLKNYHTRLHDQDALNVVMDNRVVWLPFKWNCMLGTFIKEVQFIGESKEPTLAIPRDEYEAAKNDPCIAHYAFKPWHSIYLYKYLDKNYQPIPYPHRAWWWDMALNVPAFSDIFHHMSEEDEVQKRDMIAKIDSLTQRLIHAEKKLNRLRIPFSFLSSVWKKVRFWKH